MEELSSSYAYPRKKKAKVSDERTDITPLHEDELEAKEFIDKYLNTFVRKLKDSCILSAFYSFVEIVAEGIMHGSWF